MTPINMRTKSDCLRCCIAMQLGLSYEEVPDFVLVYEDWRRAAAAWGKVRGLSFFRLQATSDGELLHAPFEGADVLWIAGGPALRRRNHAVLYRGDKPFHDPHSSRAGLLSITSAMLFVRPASPQGAKA